MESVYHALQWGGSGQVLRGASTTTPLPTRGSKSAKKVVSWEIRLSLTIRALCINAFVRVESWKTSFLHVLPWSLGVLIFYITQGTILLLIWPMSKQVIKVLMKISISWRPNRFIGCLSMICYWNYPGQSMGMWFVLLWQNYHCITAPPDKDTPQLCIT